MSQLWRTDNGQRTESEDRAILKQNSQKVYFVHWQGIAEILIKIRELLKDQSVCQEWDQGASELLVDWPCPEYSPMFTCQHCDQYGWNWVKGGAALIFNRPAHFTQHTMLIEVLINGEPSYSSNMQSDTSFETIVFTNIEDISGRRNNKGDSDS